MKFYGRYVHRRHRRRRVWQIVRVDDSIALDCQRDDLRCAHVFSLFISTIYWLEEFIFKPHIHDFRASCARATQYSSSTTTKIVNITTSDINIQRTKQTTWHKKMPLNLANRILCLTYQQNECFTLLNNFFLCFESSESFFFHSFVLITSLMCRNVSIILSSTKRASCMLPHTHIHTQTARWKAKRE